MNRYKIVMLIWDCFPAVEGGAERQCRRLAVELKRYGANCIIVTSWPFHSAPRRETWEGGDIVRLGSWVPVMNWIRRRLPGFLSRGIIFWLELPFQWIARRSFLKEFNQWLRAEEAQGIKVFHAHESIWLPGLAMEAARKVGGVALGKATIDNPLGPVGYDIPFRKKWSRLRLDSAYVAPSEYLKQGLIQKGISEDRIFIVPNGVILPEKISPRKNTERVLYVGNLSQGKGHKAFNILFDAWKQVHERFPEAQLDLLGGGKADFWKNYVDRLGCTSSVRFLGYQSDPSIFFQEAGCFVLPSWKEGMSNALLEAQAWGLPCVLSDIPANRSVAIDEENALFVPVGSASALAEGICRLLSNMDLSQKLGTAARQNIGNRFNIRSTALQLLKIYQQLIEELVRLPPILGPPA